MKFAIDMYSNLIEGGGKMKKVALVTGAAAGIGQAIALELAKAGYLVYANARSEEKLAQTLEMGKEYDIKPLIFDVCDVKSVEKGISGLEKIDCLVNDAGISIKNKTIEEFDEYDWDLTLSTNVKGYFFVAKYALEKMSKGSCIINMSSGAAKTGGEFVSIPYSTSKGAINSLTVSLARELAKVGIRVNAVSPGFVDTEMLEVNGLPTEYYNSVIPIGRVGKPLDIANMVVYLASEKADFITGQIIEVNGGDIMG